MKLAPAAAPESEPLLEPGEYLLVLAWFQRRWSLGGKPYLLCRFEVISGPARGRSFSAVMGLDLSRPGARGRWRVWAEQCGVREEIDLDDDAAISAAFVHRPFKARVRVDASTPRRAAVNDLEIFVYPRLYNSEDHAEIERWLAEQRR